MDKQVRFETVKVGDVFKLTAGGQEYRKASARLGNSLSDSTYCKLRPSDDVTITLPDPTPEQLALEAQEQATRRLLRVSNRIDQRIAEAKEDIARFTKKLTENPFEAFKWGDDAVKAAAALDANLMLRQMFDNHGADITVVETRKQVVHAAMYPPSSTSAMSNLASAAYTAALARFVDECEGH